MLKATLFSALLALTMTAAVLPAQAGQKSPAEAEADSMLAAITGDAGKLGRQANIPAVLSEGDEQLYRAAFQAQDKGRWGYADALIARLRDGALMGPLLAQRYLSSGYKPTFAQLQDWMSRFGDEAAAPAVYRLARHRFADEARQIPAPFRSEDVAQVSSADSDAVAGDFAYESVRSLASADRRRLDAAKERFRDYLRNDDIDGAVAALNGERLVRIFDKIDYDEMKTALAQALFADGRDQEALRWAEDAADRSGDLLPEAHWVAGLALWRSGHHAESVRHFEAVANSEHVTADLRAAGAFWASRANLAAHHPEVVNHWLLQAAAEPHTFYGLLSRRALGQTVESSWETRPFTDLDANTLSHTPSTRRALALLQVGRKDDAEDELRLLSANASPALAQSLLSLAVTADMPDLTVNLSGVVAAADGRLHDSSSYPVPNWQPLSGWAVDRALVLAIARQESSLNPSARSPSGAIGLMQLMPRTARAMGHHGRLTNPAVNLDVGQRYVLRLLQDNMVKGNLLLMAAAYNSGPGNVARWLQAMHNDNDALLFMESIPVRETRTFVQRVMTNFWTYRNRLGQDAPSLDAISAGNWPIYHQNEPVAVIRH
ncbi:soluble lytic murein transglycosylase precursor [mine drainage metagenome]|uniref:Soluble lytic murein transglycosylase n=1 Tax=mine drainage metagenome TaxID=410659 RepID=A0A1J5S9U7_9ZZZZ